MDSSYKLRYYSDQSNKQTQDLASIFTIVGVDVLDSLTLTITGVGGGGVGP